MRLALRGAAFVVLAFVASRTVAATREETLALLDQIVGRKADASRVEAWLAPERGRAVDRSRNTVFFGFVEPLIIVSSGAGHVVALRVDGYGNMQPFPGDTVADVSVNAMVETAIPQEGSGAVRLPVVGDEDIYVFATKEPVDAELLGADLWNLSPDDSSKGPTIAGRIAKRMNSLPEGALSVAVVRLRVVPRLKKGASEPDYTAADIIDHYKNFPPVLTKSFLPTRFPGLVRFPTNLASLSPEGMRNLDQWVTALTSKLNGASFAIEGHTDDVGKDEPNMILSRKRAEAVRDYLVLHGVSSERLKPDPRGEAHPIEDGTSDKARQANRRVDFRIMGMN